MSLDEITKLERAAHSLKKSSKGDASTILRAVKAYHNGKASPTQLAHARKLARGVRS